LLDGVCPWIFRTSEGYDEVGKNEIVDGYATHVMGYQSALDLIEIV